MTDSVLDTSKNLGFRLNTHVRLSKRFFVNHAIDYVNLGEGIIIEKVQPTDKTLPCLKVVFPYHRAFFNDPVLHHLVITSKSENGVIKVETLIHPVYLEKAETKKKK